MEKASRNKKFIRSKNLSIFISCRSAFSYPDKLEQKGFSLVELLIVVALIGILSIIAVPQINTMTNHFRLNGATRLVWGDLQNAKMTAIKTNQSVVITFNSTTNYSFPIGGGNTFTRDLVSEYPNIMVTKSGGGTITFSSTGMTQAATVTVQGSTGTKTISILGTGRVLIN